MRLVESYVFRRAICAIPTNSLNKTFAGMSGTLKKDRYLESVKAAFSLLPSYRRFPSDEEFQREIKLRDLYNSAEATGCVALKTMAGKSGWWWRTAPLSTSCLKTKHFRLSGKSNLAPNGSAFSKHGCTHWVI